MSRALTPKNLYDKTFKLFEFEGIYKEVFGSPSRGGIWLIYGKDKNGKSWTSLILSRVFTKFGKVLYVSAEEGADVAFINAMARAKIAAKEKNINVIEYVPIEELYIILKRKRAPKVVVLDNTTIYKDELKGSGMTKLMHDFPNVTFLIVAHEERNKPYTSAAMMAHKLAKIIIRVQGLTMLVSGRCPGGRLAVDEEKALLYHGSEILNNEESNK